MSLRLRIIPQISETHCGPATLQMLYQHAGIHVTQEEIVSAARVKSVIGKAGIRPHQLARAVTALTPHFHLYFKNKARTPDLLHLLNRYKVPVGIVWQSLFYSSPAEEKKVNPKGDFGHYSIVIGLNPEKDRITIADPYPDYAKKSRSFSYTWFKSRWWDAVRDLNPRTKKVTLIRPYRFLFVIAMANAPYIKALHLKPASQLSQLDEDEKAIRISSKTFPYAPL